jgi:hypothetical protein
LQPGANRAELLKLRGEVGRLRKQVADAASSRKTQSAPRTASAGTGQEAQKEQEAMEQQAIAKMGYAKNWIMAFYLYSQKNRSSSRLISSRLLPSFGNDQGRNPAGH